MTMWDKNNNVVKTQKQLRKEARQAKRKNWAAYFIAIIVIACGVVGGVFYLSEKLTGYIDTQFIQAGVVHQPKLSQ